jgi:hypothetical protein
MVKREKDLPQEIQDSINSDDKFNAKYVVYVEHTGNWDPYDVETATCYVNDDKNLGKGYKYTIYINHARPGTYWGD